MYQFFSLCNVNNQDRNPGGSYGEVWGVNKTKKKTGRYGEQSEREAMEKMTTRGRVIEMEILRKRGTKHKETQ